MTRIPIGSAFGLCVAGDCLYLSEADRDSICALNLRDFSVRGWLGMPVQFDSLGRMSKGALGVCADVNSNEVYVTCADRAQISVFRGL
jgi:hypothetical protein